MADRPDFKAEGLLEGLDSESARNARCELLTQLYDDGVALPVLREAVEQDRLALLPAERILGGGDGIYTGREVASKSGLDLEQLQQVRRSLGLIALDPDEELHGESDLQAACRTKNFLDAGLSQESILEVNRVLGHGLSQLAAAIRSVFRDEFRYPGDTERDLGLRYAQLSEDLVPELEPVLTYVLTEHLREQTRADVINRTERAAGDLKGSEEVTACFADLVDFTKLGEQVPPEELGAIAGRLTDLAMDVAKPPVRLIKMIGDAAMLVCPKPEPLVEAALTLVDAVDQEGEDFPQLHVGVATGPALHRGGDWYGRSINLASRLTSVAYPGSVLATKAIREQLPDAFDYSEAGFRSFKGIEGKVGTLRIRRAALDVGDDEG
ncbi:MAG: adenylate cyclase regulatory domain-containing protein [Solirubrobacterales bacterium]